MEEFDYLKNLCTNSQTVIGIYIQTKLGFIEIKNISYNNSLMS